MFSKTLTLTQLNLTEKKLMISLDKMNLVMTVEYGKGVKGFESYYFMAYIDLGMAVCLMNKSCFVISKQYHAL